MSTRRLEVELRQRQCVGIIDLRGEINAFAEEALNAAYAEAERCHPEVILLNFADVGYINSTGIALIVGLLARARASQRRLAACGLNEHYAEIFAITRLADFMTLFADESSALAGVAPDGQPLDEAQERTR